MSTAQPNADSDGRPPESPGRRQMQARTAGLTGRASVAAVATIGLIIGGGLSAGARSAPRKATKRVYTETFRGARIDLQGASFESIYKVVSTVNGTGAGIQDGTFTATTFPLTAQTRSRTTSLTVYSGRQTGSG